MGLFGPRYLFSKIGLWLFGGQNAYLIKLCSGLAQNPGLDGLWLLVYLVKAQALGSDSGLGPTLFFTNVDRKLTLSIFLRLNC
jgi:hypothetical protein